MERKEKKPNSVRLGDEEIHINHGNKDIIYIKILSTIANALIKIAYGKDEEKPSTESSDEDN